MTKRTLPTFNKTQPAEKVEEAVVEGDTPAAEGSADVQAVAAEEPVVVAEPIAEPEPTAAPVEAVEVKPTDATTNIARALNLYVLAMNPVNPITEAEAVAQQKRLRAAIINAIVTGDDAAGVKCIQYMLDFIHADKTGCFQMRTAFRGFDSASFTKGERRELETLLTLLMETAKPESRGKVARKFDWDTMAGLIGQRYSAVVMQRLRKVYGIE